MKSSSTNPAYFFFSLKFNYVMLKKYKTKINEQPDYNKRKGIFFMFFKNLQKNLKRFFWLD